MFLRFFFISSLLLPHTVTLWHHHSDHPLSLCCSSSDRLSPHTSLSFSFKTTLFLLAVPHSHLVHGRVILLSMETQLTFVCTHSPPSAMRLVSVIPASLATWFKTIQSCYLIIRCVAKTHWCNWSVFYSKTGDLTTPHPPHWNLLPPPTTTSSDICISQ